MRLADYMFFSINQRVIVTIDSSEESAVIEDSMQWPDNGCLYKVRYGNSVISWVWYNQVRAETNK